ncbi:hypothetical protein AVEN_257642-1 [Araneus ventricosus]|uniref:Uncharacterized protein n=1 Tax=Araneus ventricosus TaxID=182803 RepID=A0A4Y2RM99_ARAVE|nr:hypothetical protein AVEN_257642-1 [Araneus ventricosus]
MARQERRYQIFFGEMFPKSHRVCVVTWYPITFSNLFISIPHCYSDISSWQPLGLQPHHRCKMTHLYMLDLPLNFGYLHVIEATEIESPTAEINRQDGGKFLPLRRRRFSDVRTFAFGAQ